MNKVLGVLLLAAAACSSGREDIAVRGLAQPTEACQINADTFLPEVILDTAEGTTIDVPIVFHNTGSEELTPSSIDVSWVCATTPALLLPDVDAESNFCFDNVDPNYIGFDAYPLSTKTIAPDTRGITIARLVPAAIGSAFDRMLALAREADGCCREASCTRGDSSNEHCQKFEAMTGGEAGSLEPSRFRDFAIYDGAYADAQSDETTPLGRRYEMSARFALRGVTPSGVEVFSAPFEQKVSFCRSCGEREGEARQPMPGMSCFHSGER